MGRPLVHFEIGSKDKTKTAERSVKAVQKIAVTALTLTLTMAICAARSSRQQASAESARSMPNAAPEMDRLKFYLGEWDYTETYANSASYPNGGKNTGVYTSKPGPGGNSLLNGFHSQGPVGDFEGLMVMTWDPKEKSYKSYVFGNNFPGAVVETGQFEGDALVFRTEFSVGGATLKLRNVTHLVSPGKLVSEEYFASKDAPEALFVRVDATKR
jgi:hypothetical protein